MKMPSALLEFLGSTSRVLSIVDVSAFASVISAIIPVVMSLFKTKQIFDIEMSVDGKKIKYNFDKSELSNITKDLDAASGKHLSVKDNAEAL
jgi:hypothetical protein